MKKCYIFAGGDFDGFFDKIKKDDLIIGADKGYTYIEKIGLKPDLIIGDFDSSNVPDFNKKIILNPQKDVTDLYAGLEIAFKKGYKDIIIYGGLGGRLSHTIGNIKIMEEFIKKGVNVCLKSKNIMVFAIDKNFREEKFTEGLYISLFALTNEVKDLNLINLKYELKDFTLKNDDHIGISNEGVKKPFEIKFSSGILLVIYEKKEGFN